MCCLHKLTCLCVHAVHCYETHGQLCYISLGACQAALKPAAQRYVIVLSVQTFIYMKIVTSGFLLHSAKHLKRIRQKQTQLSLLQHSHVGADKLFESGMYVCAYVMA